MNSDFTARFRKVLSLLLVLSVLAAVAVTGGYSALAADEMVDGDLLFEENFDSVANGKLPSGWKMNKDLTSGGSASVQDGKLIIDSYNVGFGKVLLPALPEETGDYSFECDVSFISSANDSRWMSLIVRQQTADEEYLQMCVRRNTTASNGIEFARRTPGTWSVMNTGAAPSALGLNNTGHIKISIVGNRVFEYFNGKLVINTDALEGIRGIYKKGGLAIQAANAKIAIDNVKVSKCTFKEDPSTGDKSYMNYDFLNSAVVASAATVCEPSSAEELERFLSMSKRPENVILWVDEGGNFVSRDGKTVIGSFEEVYNSIYRAMVPVFGVRNIGAAEKIIEFVKSKSFVDCLFLSSDPEVLATLRSSRKKSGGVLDLTETADLSKYKTDPQEIVYAVNRSSAKTVLIPESLLDKAGVEYVQHRLITVWIREEADTPVMLHNGIQSGANGIVTDTPDQLIKAYDFYKNDISVLVRNPLIIGHRGLPSAAPENTVESAKEAVAAGADCIELDVRLSKDGVIYILHDENLAGTTNGSGSINSKTSAELDKLSVIKSSSYGTFTKYPKVKLPTLKEFFEALKDEDVMFFIEIKEEKNDITQKVFDLVEEMGLERRCCMITFLSSQIVTLRKIRPEISAGQLMGTPSANSYAGVINKVIPETVTRNATFNPSGLYSDKVIRGLMYRGVTAWPWTYGQTNTRNAYLLGVGGITTDTSGEAGDIATGINIGTGYVNRISLTTKEASSVTFTPTVNTRTGKYETGGKYPDGTVKKAPELIVLDGEEFITVKGNTVTAKAPGTAHLIYRLETSTDPSKAPTSTNGFSLYTQVITVTVTEEDLPIPTKAPAQEDPAKEPEDADKTFDPVPVIIIVLCVAVVAAGAVVVAVVLRRKKGKGEE